MKTSIDRDEFDPDPALGAEVSVKISSATFDAVDEMIGGVGFLDQASNDLITFGVYDFDGGATRIAYMIDAGSHGTPVVIGVAPALPFYLNVKFIGGSSYEVATAPDADRNSLTPLATVSVGIPDPSTVVLGMIGTSGSGGPTNAVTLDDFRLHTPAGLRSFNWYARRNPALPGAPDIPGANAVVKRVKPAHTHAAAISDISLLFDSNGSLFDDGPLES
jgi:hypothetical protein